MTKKKKGRTFHEQVQEALRAVTPSPKPCCEGSYTDGHQTKPEVCPYCTDKDGKTTGSCTPLHNTREVSPEKKEECTCNCICPQCNPGDCPPAKEEKECTCNKKNPYPLETEPKWVRNTLCEIHGIAPKKEKECCDCCECPYCGIVPHDYKKQSLPTLTEQKGESWEELKFMECDWCRGKAGTPRLCDGCLHNRQAIEIFAAKKKEWEAQKEQAVKAEIEGMIRKKIKAANAGASSAERVIVLKELLDLLSDKKPLS